MSGLVAAGCGDEEPAGDGIRSERTTPGGGGTLDYAIAEAPADLDPLLARGRDSQLVSRQIHEPLVGSLSGPFGDVRELRGLALSVRPNNERTIWAVRLRRGVRFQDGTPLNATAVLANAERWRTLPPGRDLLPGLVAVDAPRPDLVRFILGEPDPDVRRSLASPRLALVSPNALDPKSGTEAVLDGWRETGTGPFELRQRSRKGALVVRNTAWWGTPLDLGPGLDQISFEVVPSASERVRRLIAADVRVADPIDRGQLDRLRREPLLTYVGRGAGPYIGLERSVRGIDSAEAIDPLSDVWLTTVAAGG